MLDLLNKFEGLIRWKCQRVSIENFTFDELCQEGRIAVWEAIESYEQDKGSSLNTWVTLHINQRISDIITAAARKKRRNYSSENSYTLPIHITSSRDFDEYDSGGISEDEIASDEMDPEENLVFLDLIEKVRLRLSDKAKQLFDLKLGIESALVGEPSPLRLFYLAIRRDYVKKRIEHLQGNWIRGGSTPIVKNDHYATALGYSKHFVRKSMIEIEAAIREVFGDDKVDAFTSAS